MRKEFKIGFVILALIILSVAAYIGLYMYSASKVEVRQIQLAGIQNVSLEGAEILGVIELYNGGLVSVSIDKIDYRLVLENDESEILKGSIKGGAIPANQALNYSYSAKVNWKPTADLAYQMLNNGTAYARFEGNVQLTKIWFVDVSIPFGKRIDLGSYLSQYIKKGVEEYPPEDIVGKASKLLGELQKYLG